MSTNRVICIAVLFTFFCSTISVSLAADSSKLATASLTNNWKLLLDPELSQWQVFMGVPHLSVKNLPEGTFQSEDVREGIPMGINNDPNNVFSTYEQNGETILRVSGEIYGGLTSVQTFENYHLQVKYRWGNKKWEPHLATERDSGILYHCYGEHGAFWQVWKSSLELQILESKVGDLITIAGPIVKAPHTKKHGATRNFYDITQDYNDWQGYLYSNVEPGVIHDEWNTLDLYVLEGSSIHVVNNQIVMSLKDARKADGSPLKQGQIQIQSEGAEIEYKEMKIRSITAFPEVIRQQARL